MTTLKAEDIKIAHNYWWKTSVFFAALSRFASLLILILKAFDTPRKMNEKKQLSTL